VAMRWVARQRSRRGRFIADDNSPRSSCDGAMGRHGGDDDTNAPRGCQRVEVEVLSDATGYSGRRAQDGRFIAEDNVTENGLRRRDGRQGNGCRTDASSQMSTCGSRESRRCDEPQGRTDSERTPHRGGQRSEAG
jgi:hypothetical protein